MAVAVQRGVPRSDAKQPVLLRDGPFQVWSYALAAVTVAVTLAIRLALEPVLLGAAPLLLFVAPVVLASYLGGPGPGLIATALSLVAGDYFLIAPRSSLGIATVPDMVRVSIFVLEGALAAALSADLRRSRAKAARSARELESQARELREHADLLALANETVIIRDAEDRIVEWNPAAGAMYGWTRTQALGRVTHDLLQTRFPVSLGAMSAALDAAGFWEGELEHRRADGTPVFVLSRQAARRDGTGRRERVVEVNWDLTARRRAESEVRRLNAGLERLVEERTRELERANRDLDSFSAAVAHDLRAPLRAMEGFSRALLEDYGERLDETGRNYAERVVRASASMHRLIADLLEYARLGREPLPLAPVSLDDVVDGALETLRSAVRESGADAKVQRPLPAVRAHPPTLALAVGNLLENALKYARPGVSPRVRVRADRLGERVRLWVADEGIGIAPEHHERVFEPFERLHAADVYPGTGVGLALVRRAVERMGGATGVQSSLGEGSRFWLDLDAA